MTKKASPLTFLKTLERGIRDVLKDKNASAPDKLKAIEVGAKVAAIQLKVSGGDDDAFFN